MWTTLKLRARRLIHRSRLERDLDDEMRHHHELTVREYEAEGVSPAEARRLAALEFGSSDRFKEEYRDASGVRLLEDLQQDLGYTLRSLRRTPAFTTAAVATLALGIATATAVISVVHGVLLAALPYAEPDRLVRVWQHDRASETQREASSVPDYFDYVERAHTLDAFAAYAGQQRSLSLPGADPERIESVRASHTLFEILGTSFTHGRGYSAAEDAAGRGNVLVLSDRLWRARFNADERVVGRTVRLDGEPYTVIGVVAAGAEYPGPHVDAWEPLAVDVASAPRYRHDVEVIARLADGSSVAAASAEIARIMADLEAEYPASNRHRGGSVEPLHDVLLGGVRMPLLVLLGAAALLLLAACANVGNLLLARNAARSRETAVRAALGAGRSRLMRQFLAETLCLTLAAGAVGGALAWLAIRALLAIRPPELPRIDGIALDMRILAGIVALCCGIALVFALLPALQSRNSLAAGALHGARGAAVAAASGLRRTLVSAQLALSLVLLIGSGLLVRSFNALAGVDPGFTADHVLKAEFQLPVSRYPLDFDRYPDWPEVQRFYDEVLAGLNPLPGVAAVALAAQHPLEVGFTNSFVIVGREQEAAAQPEIRIRAVTTGYMDAVSTRLIAGRAIGPRDESTAPPVAVINEAAARQHFPDDDAIGSFISFWGTPREVVGIIGNERFAGVAHAAPAAVYTPLAQTPMHSGVILLRTTLPPLALARDVRRVINAVDPELALAGVEPLDRTVAASIARERMLATLFVAFAAAALLLGLTGVYGLVAYLLAQRAHEVGIRAAIGATPGMLRRMFLREGLQLGVAGAAAGLVVSLVVTRTLQALLFGISATDVPTYVVAVSMLLLVAAAASWLPARRASLVSPLRALRGEP